MDLAIALDREADNLFDADPGADAVGSSGEDARLIAAARRGDRRAFETLYSIHVGRVFAVCLRLTAHTETAEEMTQEAFVRAWQRLSSFRGDSAFGTWLHRLTVNVVLDQQRAQRSWIRRLIPMDDAAEVAATEQIRSVTEADHHDLESAIRRLPPGARTVFVLHDVEGWKHDEIAARTGTAIGTSKAHLHRARQLLKEWLSL